MLDQKKKYFLSFMDILGYAKIVVENQSQLEQVRDSLYTTIFHLRDFILTGRNNESFIANIQESEEYLLKFPVPAYVKDILTNNFTVFSDSLIFYIEVNEKDCEDVVIEKLKSICWVSNHFIAKSILYKGNLLSFPYRCGISYGDMVINKKNGIFIGQPFIDSYNVSESQEWMGGALHTSIPSKYYQAIVGINEELIEHEIPLNFNKIREKQLRSKSINIALNWVNHHPSDPDLENTPLRDGPTLADVGGHVRKKFKWRNGGITGRIKGSNTLDFVKFIDNKLNENAGISKSTLKDLKFPDWYIAGKISNNRDMSGD